MSICSLDSLVYYVPIPEKKSILKLIMQSYDISYGMLSDVIISNVISLRKYQHHTALCIRWPESMQFKGCIIDR